jgi:hypothetical protein
MTLEEISLVAIVKMVSENNGSCYRNRNVIFLHSFLLLDLRPAALWVFEAQCVAPESR